MFPDRPPPSEDWLALKSAVRRFDDTWRKGSRPTIDDYLPPGGGLRCRLLIELVHIDLELRLKAGEPARVEEYLARYSELAADRAATLELVAAEHALRRRGEPQLCLGEYLERFPQYRAELPEQLARPSVAGGDAPRPQAPPEVAGYEVLGPPLGRGGMGVVYQARDTHLGRDVAVKVLLEGHQRHPELYERFVEEARVAGRLQHPGVVPVYALGEAAPGRPYFTMKLVQGQTLAELLRDRADPVQGLPRFLKVFEAVCQAVGYAHSKGVIHRDLKPANVMVGSFGEVQLMDWGLAKVLASRERQRPEQRSDTKAEERETKRGGAALTGAGAVLGTPAYLSPEQARGEPVDQRCDVFGLGALLCEILTGRPPYGGLAGREAERQAREGDLAEAWARLARCAAEGQLVGLARACLAPKRDERPRDAGVVAEAVTAYLAGVQERLQAAEVRRATAEVEAAAERKRRRLTVALAAAVLALGALGGGGAWWLSGQRAEAERAVQLARQQAQGLHEQARAAGVGDPLAWTRAVDAAQHADGLATGGW